MFRDSLLLVFGFGVLLDLLSFLPVGRVSNGRRMNGTVTNATLHVCLLEFFDLLVFYGSKQCCWTRILIRIDFGRLHPDPGGQK
jgi:hypothetical protein